MTCGDEALALLGGAERMASEPIWLRPVVRIQSGLLTHLLSEHRQRPPRDPLNKLGDLLRPRLGQSPQVDTSRPLSTKTASGA